MSETPSLYDLTQDALIGPMRDILLTAAEPPSGPEFSYPVVDQAVSSSMWSWITLGMGSGILDAGGRPYWLTSLDNAANTATLTPSTTIGTANALIRGFFHQLSESMTVSLPMPSSGTTTYHVCLTYDPREESSSGGPISVQTYAGAPPPTFGRHHIVLWTVRRTANQLLTDAVVTQVRPKVAPTITVDTDEQRLAIPTRSLLWGTLCLVHSTGEMWRAMGSSADEQSGGPTGWRSVTDPGWVEYGDTPTYGWPGFGHRRAIQRVGKRRRLRGNVRPRDNSAMTSTSTGYLMFTLADGDVPAHSEKFVVAGSGNQNSATVAIIVGGKSDANQPGEVRAFPKETTSWVSLSGVSWDV